MPEERNDQEHFQPIPSPFDVRIQEADLYITHGLYEEAASAYRDLLEDIKNGDLDGPEKNRLILLVQEKLNRAVEESSSDDSDISVTPASKPLKSDPALVFNQGLALQDVGLFEEAMAEFRRAIEMNYRMADAYEHYGDCVLALGKPEEAVESFEKALELDLPDERRKEVVLKVAEVAEILSDYQRAFEYYNEVVLSSDEKYIHIEEKLVRVKEKLKEEHLEKLERFIELGDVVESRVILEILAKELDATPKELLPYCERLSFSIEEIFPAIETLEGSTGDLSLPDSQVSGRQRGKKSSISVVKELGLPDIDSPRKAFKRPKSISGRIEDHEYVGKQLHGVDPELLPEIISRDKSSEYDIVAAVAEGSTSLVFKVKEAGSGRTFTAQSLVETVGRFYNDLSFYVKWARIISNMWCKQVAVVRDIAVLDDRPFLIYEHLGHSLVMVLEEKESLPVEQFLIIAHNILKGVAYCHSHLGLDEAIHKVYHLDLRPSRIVWDTTRPHRQKIINQGLVSLMAEGKGDPLEYGLFDLPHHLLAYKAPEQFNPEILRKLHRPPVCTDIYALGVIMYEMLTGCVPFIGPTYDDFMKQHLNRYPIPPKVLVSTIPEELDAVILKCLRKKPMERWRSVTELELALEKIKV